MPLRDHFRPPLFDTHSWEGFHGGWPMVIVQQLVRKLPKGYMAEPRVHPGTFFEVDVGTFDLNYYLPKSFTSATEGGVATLPMAPPEPTLSFETDLPEPSEYEVLVYDFNRGRQLVAAIELVSPSNKDRPESRQSFVSKCAGLIQQKISVTIVDLVTIRHFNLFGEVLELFADKETNPNREPRSIYAGTCRSRRAGGKTIIDSWYYPLVIGVPLPSLPIWLDVDDYVTLDLNASYEQTCQDLRIE